MDNPILTLRFISIVIVGLVPALTTASAEAAEQKRAAVSATQQSKTSDDPQQLLANFTKQWDESKWEKVFRGGTYMRTTGDAGWKLRMTTLRSLVLAGAKSVPALTAALDSEHEPTRILAAQSLSFLAPHSDLDRLTLALTKDKSAPVRLYAADSLGMSGKTTDTNWQQLVETERNRDVRKHMGYAKERGTNGISNNVITALREWNPKAMDSAKVGSPAPDFRLKTIDGKEIALSDYRDRQPVVLVFIYGDT